jgi:LPXTG-motif cell wall-anchored protein
MTQQTAQGAKHPGKTTGDNMNKTLKVATLSAAMIASVGAFTVLTMPSVARAENICNANPSADDFTAAYVNGSVNTAHVAYVGELPMCEGASQVFSLNSYANEGDSWETSGVQTLVDHATVTLNAAKTEADLTVQMPGADCFYQTDLYANGKKYDGVSGSLPHYPDTEAPDNYIDSRSGGSEVCEGGQGGGTPITTLPETGAADFQGVIALGAGLVAGGASYLRTRRSR